MYPTNALRVNPQVDDEDIRSEMSDIGDHQDPNDRRRRKKDRHHKSISGPPKSYTPYQDALYYNSGSGSGNSNDHHSTPQMSSPAPHRRERHSRHYDPEERVLEERWVRRRRWGNGEEEEEGCGAAKEDPWDLDSNQRVGGRGPSRGRGGHERHQEVYIPVPLPVDVGRRSRVEPEYDEYGDYARRKKGQRRLRGRCEEGEEDDDDDEEHFDSRDDDDDDDNETQHRNQKGGATSRGERARSRHRRSSRSRSESRRRRTAPHEDPYKPLESYTILKAAKAAAWPAAIEAWRCRKEEGPWTGQKGRRILVASTMGLAIGALRNGRLLNAGKKPYAEAAMTGFYGIDFMKRVAAHTEHGKGALREQREWKEEKEGRAPWQTCRDGERRREGRGRA